MSQVVTTIKDSCNHTFQLYDDGDIVVTGENFGYIQITSDILQKLSANASKSRVRNKDVGTSTSFTQSNDLDSNQIVVSQDPLNKQLPERPSKDAVISRKYSPLEDKSGWLCVFNIPGSSEITHVYATRSAARAGTHQTQIGTAGRIS